MTIQQMLKELVGLGLSQIAIARITGTSQPTINRALKGADVRYELGKAIEILYFKEIPAPPSRVA